MLHLQYQNTQTFFLIVYIEDKYLTESVMLSTKNVPIIPFNKITSTFYRFAFRLILLI